MSHFYLKSECFDPKCLSCPSLGCRVSLAPLESLDPLVLVVPL